MRIVWEIIEYLVCFVETYIAYKVLEIFFPARNSRKKQKEMIILALVGAVVTRICNQISLFSYFTIFISVFYSSVSGMYIYRAKCIQVLSIISFYGLCLCGLDFLVMTTISSFYKDIDMLNYLLMEMSSLRIGVIFFTKILWVAIYLVLKKYLKKISFTIKGTYATLLTSVIGFCGFIFLAEQAMQIFNYTVPWVWFMFICILVLIVLVFYFMIEQQKEKTALSFMEMQSRLLEDKYKTLNDVYMENAKLYHDLNNHLNTLYQLLEEKQGEAAKAYIKEISKPILKLSKTIWTGVDVVDVIINSKLEKMEQLGIEADINVEYPSECNITPNDMCTILSNLLDNAIEAAAETEQKGCVCLTVRRINYLLLIKVTNPCSEHIKSFEDIPKTTKANKNLHGWGLRSVRDTVEKYSGTLECGAQDGVFTVKIMMQWEKKAKIV